MYRLPTNIVASEELLFIYDMMFMISLVLFDQIDEYRSTVSPNILATSQYLTIIATRRYIIYQLFYVFCYLVSKCPVWNETVGNGTFSVYLSGATQPGVPGSNNAGTNDNIGNYIQIHLFKQ